MAPKAKKGTTMSLADFLQAGDVNDSWAEEPFQLPSAPRGMSEPALPSGPSGAFGGSNYDANDRRRPGRFSESGSAGGPIVLDQTRLPSAPPYTAFVGNLPFDITEGDLRTFFQMRDIPAGSVVSISLPRDHENKARGFGYVEFASVEHLTRALMASNQFQIRNRVVRIDFSEGKTRTDREVRPSDASHNWRDGATAGGSVFGGREVREVREPRPVSVAESNMNWRDGARAAPVAPVHYEAPKSIARRPEQAAPVAEPVRNWRDSARPVEAAPAAKPVAPVAAAKPVQSESKVPTGSWRRQ